MPKVPDKWEFDFSATDACFGELTWEQAVKILRNSEFGSLSAYSGDQSVSLEFNATHAAVVVHAGDGQFLRPYFPRRSNAEQDVSPFFCNSCGIREGDTNEYLARFVSRDDGFRLFQAVLSDDSLPSHLPDANPNQLVLPGLEQVAQEVKNARLIEWRPIPPESSHPAKDGG